MTETAERRFLSSTANRVEKHRKVSYEWEIDTIPASDGHGERKVLAVLSIFHRKAGANYFSGEMTTEDHFDVTLGRETAEVRFNAAGERIAEVRGFKLFDAIGIGRIPAGNRYSAKKLREAAHTGYAAFREAYEAGDERVLRYFDREMET